MELRCDIPTYEVGKGKVEAIPLTNIVSEIEVDFASR